MLFEFDERCSDAPFVERIWYAQSMGSGTFLSVAASQWEMVFSRYQGSTTVTVRGPETKAVPVHFDQADAEFFGIVFKLGTTLYPWPVSTLVDREVDLPEASGKSFWLHGSAMQFPDYENADTFIKQLAREDLLTHDPIVASVLEGQPQQLSPRSVQRRFLHATGLTQGFVRQIERARYATVLLQQGVSIFDTVQQTGYADQPHLTRSLKRLVGKTPAEIVRKTEPEQMSLLFKTEPLP